MQPTTTAPWLVYKDNKLYVDRSAPLPEYLIPKYEAMKKLIPFAEIHPSYGPMLDAAEQTLLKEEMNCLVFADVVKVSPFMAFLFCEANGSMPEYFPANALFKLIIRLFFLIINSANSECDDWKLYVKETFGAIEENRFSLVSKLFQSLRLKDQVFSKIFAKRTADQTPASQQRPDAIPDGSNVEFQQNATAFRQYMNVHNVSILRTYEQAVAYLCGMDLKLFPLPEEKDDPFTGYGIPPVLDDPKLLEVVKFYVLSQATLNSEAKADSGTKKNGSALEHKILLSEEYDVVAKHPLCMNNGTCATYLGAWMRMLKVL